MLFQLPPTTKLLGALVLCILTLFLAVDDQSLADEGSLPDEGSDTSLPTPDPARTHLTPSLEGMNSDRRNLYYTVASQLRCPTCNALSVLQSDAPFSLQIQNTLLEQVRQGHREREILDFFTQRYGLWILREPPKRGFHLLAWWIPLLLLLAGPAAFLWGRKKNKLLSSTSPPLYQQEAAEQILWQMERKLHEMRYNKAQKQHLKQTTESSS